ncbi:hypothetical protein Dda_6344 [Drechslerella dactyloides]|uniref:F-box domain-containing protein n=1 Tax=Drechslerella dactyloides TaxID=74499 RepID=A0AAD6IUL1_DREDA|nr:hypothetical protein Dda_6344 [Drechslerella dactyloides]
MELSNEPSPILTIPEILTLILSHVPPIELLVSCRRVCRNWKATIDASPILRWQTWTSHSTAAIPPSIRDSSPLDACIFELNPLALHFVQRVWRQYMAQPSSATRNGLLASVQSSLDAHRTAPRPTRNLLRPANRTRNIWIYAGGGSGSDADMDILKYHYNYAGAYVSIDALVSTLLEGRRRAERAVADFEIFSASSDGTSEEEDNYYSLIIHAFAERGEQDWGIMKDTEIRIRLQMFEPFDIAGVSVGTEIMSRRVRYVGGSGGGIMMADPWKDVKRVLGTGLRSGWFNGISFLA